MIPRYDGPLGVVNYEKLDETKRQLLPLRPVYYLVRTAEPSA
jgi:hypothetical protein